MCYVLLSEMSADTTYLLLCYSRHHQQAAARATQSAQLSINYARAKQQKQVTWYLSTKNVLKLRFEVV